jgi:hypothetical protein
MNRNNSVYRPLVALLPMIVVVFRLNDEAIFDGKMRTYFPVMTDL